MSNSTEQEILDAKVLASVNSERNVYKHRYNTMNSIVKHLQEERQQICEQLIMLGYIFLDGKIVKNEKTNN